MTQTDKRIEWKERFDDWKSSGLSVAKWCRLKGIKNHQMYYWIQKFESNSDSHRQDAPEIQWGVAVPLKMSVMSIVERRAVVTITLVGEHQLMQLTVFAERMILKLEAKTVKIDVFN